MKSWYLIQTKPRQEDLARYNLQRQGYTVYLPITLVRRRKRGKSYSAPGPMFPLYLFIQLNSGIDDWGPIRSTIGVARLVKFGQMPARVPDDLMSILKEREDTRGIQIIPERAYRQGESVRISEGPFEGYEAIVYAKSAKERIVLLLKVVENYIKIELNTRELEPL